MYHKYYENNPLHSSICRNQVATRLSLAHMVHNSSIATKYLAIYITLRVEYRILNDRVSDTSKK